MRAAGTGLYAEAVTERPASKGRRVAARILYWVAVVVVSTALVIALILFLESRDQSTIGSGAPSASLSA